MHFEIRLANVGRNRSDQTWVYRANDIADAARMHVDILYAHRCVEPPDYWTLFTLLSKSEPSRVDGRILYEAQFKTNRFEGPNEYEAEQFYVRPLAQMDESA